jgi:hypothetical protein
VYKCKGVVPGSRASPKSYKKTNMNREILSQRASYIGAIQADQTVESDHSDLLVHWTRALTDTSRFPWNPLSSAQGLVSLRHHTSGSSKVLQ